MVIVGDLIPERLEQARSFGCETVDVSKGDPKEQIAQLIGERPAEAINPPAKIPELDAGVDAVGFEAQTPVKTYNRELMMAILNDRCQIAKAANATVIPLDDAPEGYRDFDRGAARKYVLNPHGMIRA